MFNKEIHIKIWHLILFAIVVFLIWTNYVQKLTTNKLELEKTELVKKNLSNNDKIKGLEIVINGYDLKIATKDSLIVASEKREKQWRWSYYKLKKQADNENINPVHNGTNDRANYLITKYRDTK